MIGTKAVTKPNAQSKPSSARPAQSAIQKDILPLEQMMAPDETNVQAQPSTEQDNNGTLSPAPALRFEGFFEPWHKRQLMDVAQIIGGGTPSTSIKAYWDGSINWFTPAELGDHIFVYHSERKITQQGIEHSTAKLLPQGTILYYSRGAGLGKTAILATPSTTNQGFQSIVPSPKELDSYFIFSCSNQLKAYGVSVGGGSTFKEVSGKQMEVMPLLIPSLPEQQRIGTLFKELDRNLSLNRAQLEKLTQLKTSMLEQMFPKEGEDVPRLRFDGFTEPWSQHVLGELGQVISGIAFPEMVQGGSEGIPFFKVSDMNLDGNEFIMCSANNYVTLDDIKLHNWRPIDGPAIFFAKVGAAIFLNRKRLVLSKFLLDNNTMAYIINTELLDRYFAFVMFGLLNLPSLVQNGALPSYGAKDVSSMLVKIPPLPEQKRIGAFFQALDERLALQRAKIEKLEQLKKALLEQMFV